MIMAIRSGLSLSCILYSEKLWTICVSNYRYRPKCWVFCGRILIKLQHIYLTMLLIWFSSTFIDLKYPWLARIYVMLKGPSAFCARLHYFWPWLTQLILSVKSGDQGCNLVHLKMGIGLNDIECQSFAKIFVCMLHSLNNIDEFQSIENGSISNFC